MKRLPLRALAILGVMLTAAPAFAVIESKSFSPTDTGISNVALNVSRTMTLTVSGYSQVSLYVQLTRNAATAVNVSCSAGPSASQLASLGVATVSGSGTISMADASWTYPVSTSRWIRIQVTPLNDQILRCVFTGTGATSSDLISVYARAGVP